MALWAAVRQWAKTVPIRLHVKHRHFRETHENTGHCTQTHTRSLWRLLHVSMPETLWQWKQRRSCGEYKRACTTSPSSPSFSLLCVLSSLLLPLLLPYQPLLPFIPIFFSALHPPTPSLSALEYVFFSFAFPVSSSLPPVFFSWLLLSLVLFSFSLLLPNSVETYEQWQYEWARTELLFFFFFKSQAATPKAGNNLSLLSLSLSPHTSLWLISANKHTFNSYFLCAWAVSDWEVKPRKSTRAYSIIVFFFSSLLIHCLLYLDVPTFTLLPFFLALSSRMACSHRTKADLSLSRTF